MVEITNSYASEIMEWIGLSFSMLGLFFCHKLDWNSSTVFTIKTATKKIGALIRFLRLCFVSINVPSDMA